MTDLWGVFWDAGMATSIFWILYFAYEDKKNG